MTTENNDKQMERKRPSSLDMPFSFKEKVFFVAYLLTVPWVVWFPLLYVAALIRTYPSSPNFYGLWLSPRILTFAYVLSGLSLINHPRIVRERMQRSGLHGDKPGEPWKEKLAQSILLVLCLAIIFVSCYEAAGREDEVPTKVYAAGSIMIVLSLILVSWVFRTNSYGAKVVYKQQGQQLITTGPYAFVRHPMYSFFVPFFLGIPLMIGSYYGITPSVLVVLSLMWRTYHEEEFLVVEEFGDKYRAYQRKVPWRMLPKIF